MSRLTNCYHGTYIAILMLSCPLVFAGGCGKPGASGVSIPLKREQFQTTQGGPPPDVQKVIAARAAASRQAAQSAMTKSPANAVPPPALNQTVNQPAQPVQK